MAQSQQAKKEYFFKDLNGKDRKVAVPDDVEAEAEQARKDYETSKRYINQQHYDTWRYALKCYHLSTYDRKAILKTWQSNISIGLVRSFVDVLVWVVQEKPLVFIGTPINKIWLENKEYILKSLNYVSDVTGFHKTIKQCLKNWLILWTLALRVNYLKTEKKTTITTIINDEAVEKVVEVSDDQVKDYPSASNVSIFNIFPDPYRWKLRYITERWVVSYLEAMNTFGNMIKRSDNRSPLKDPIFLKSLPLPENINQADFLDYGAILDQIQNKVNEELRQKDKYWLQSWMQNNIQTTGTALTQDEDKDVTQWLIEFKYTVYDDRIILHFNNYPVYVWPNFYGFINYVIKAAGDDDVRFWEWIPYMLRGIEEVWTSFVNNYFDWARALATPTFVAVKNLLLNEWQLESWQPWGTIWIEWGDTNNAVRRLEKGWLSDFNIYPIITQIAQQITGISEYNLWQSAWERTATGALSVAQSSNKRMSPYMSTFVDVLSTVAQMWLSLMKKNWTKEQWIYVNDEQWNQVFEAIKNNQLTWGINISLQAEWLFGSTNELELQKLIQVYQTLAMSWAIKSWELASEIMKKAWFTPSRFIINPDQVKPDAIWSTETQFSNPEADLWQILTEANNSQVNLWNWGKWQ